jgi:hypothetical protein
MQKENNNKDKDFVLYNKIIDYKNYVNKYIAVSIPTVYRNIRIHFLDELYNLSKNMFYAVYNVGNIRDKYIKELQVNLSLLDMMTTELRELNCINDKYLYTSINKLSNIKNIVYAWKLNEEKKK